MTATKTSSSFRLDHSKQSQFIGGLLRLHREGQSVIECMLSQQPKSTVPTYLLREDKANTQIKTHDTNCPAKCKVTPLSAATENTPLCQHQ